MAPSYICISLRAGQVQVLAALLHGHIVLVGGHGAVGRAHDPVAGDHLLDAVGAPAGDTGGGEQRREHLLGDAQHGVHQTGVHIHVGAHGRVAALALHHQRDADLLHLLQQGEIIGVALQLRHALGVLLQQHGTGVGHGIHRVTQSVDLAGAVAGLLIQQLVQIVPDGAVVVGIHVLLHIPEHLHDLGVGAAVKRPLQGAHSPGDGAVGIRAAGGHGAADEGGVIASAVLGVYHQHHIQQVGFLVGVALIRAHHPQEVLRRGQLRHREVDVQGVAVEVVPLHRVGVGYDGREIADELHRLQKHVVNGRVVRVGIVGVQAQHAARQLVHDVVAGVAHDHALGEPLRQLPRLVHDLVEVGQLASGGQIAHQQQVGYLLEAEGARRAVRLHDVRQLDAPVVQAARRGDALAVLHQIALHAAHLGHAHQHAGAVAVAQTQLHVAPVVIRADGILLLNAAAQGGGILL